MNKWLTGLTVIFLTACKSETKDPNAAFFPVASFLKGQVAQVDSTLNAITKIVTVNGISDTSFIKREDFRKYAGDFLSLPDIASDDLSDDYTETQMFDEDLQSVILNYTPKEKDAPILRQEVMIQPGNGTEDKVKRIYIERFLSTTDSTVQKRLTWQVAQRFQVVTITQKPGAPDKVQTLLLIWDGNMPTDN